MIWSITSLLFVWIGYLCRKATTPMGFYTFEEAPKVNNVKAYNKELSNLWFITAIAFEITGLPFLFLKQNSPFFILMMLPIIFGFILMMIKYNKIVENIQNNEEFI